jgi:hypothetical protein
MARVEFSIPVFWLSSVKGVYIRPEEGRVLVPLIGVEVI